MGAEVLELCYRRAWMPAVTVQRLAGRRAVVKKVFSSLELPISPRILEADCGTGGNLPLLAEFGK